MNRQRTEMFVAGALMGLNDVFIHMSLQAPQRGAFALGQTTTHDYVRDALPVIDANDEPTTVPIWCRNGNGRLCFRMLPGMRPAAPIKRRIIGDPNSDYGGDWVYDAEGNYVGEWL